MWEGTYASPRKGEIESIFVGRMKNEDKNRKDQALEVEGESIGIEEHLWDNVETKCSRNSLESISKVLVKTPRNGEYRA